MLEIIKYPMKKKTITTNLNTSNEKTNTRVSNY